MKEVTFENLPHAVRELSIKLDNIEKLLCSQANQHETDHLLTIQQAAEFLKLTVPTIYGYVSRNEIPFSKKGKRLYFSKQKLMEWGKTGRKKTIAEIIGNFNNKAKRDGKLSPITELMIKLLFDILKGVIKGVILYYICK
ncbi:MAG: helix-turn-helix domain-containing protein [Bacteroidia bacterium]